MERILHTIGISLLALCFVISLGRIAMLRLGERTESGDKVIEIRLAHWQLEGGIRESITAMAAEYMKLHPGVRITQISIPERIYPNWVITQLVGGTAPDLIQVGYGSTDERLARYFVPLTDLAQSPNPYNKGTRLENTPLRDTFSDGMEGGFNPNLLEYYAVPLTGFSIRLYVNQDLLQEITGSKKLPETYEELIELAKRVKEFSRNQRPIIPIAGSRYNSPKLMDNLFASQTQKKLIELGPVGTLSAVSQRTTEALMDGDWGLDSPEVRSGLELMREIANEMQPGFMQVSRDDASFYFVQGRALMIVTGNWDATSISQQATFPFAVTKIPLPSKQHPRFGPNVLGAFSEAGRNDGLCIGLSQNSQHPEVAADFLRFLASQPANQLFTDISQWLPSVVGVEPAKLAKAFAIQSEGYSPGFALMNFGPDSNRLIVNNYNHLVGPGGSVDEFVEAIRPNFISDRLKDLKRQELEAMNGIRRMDVQFAALAELARANPEDERAQTKLEMIAAAMSGRERGLYFQQDLVRKAEKRVKEDSK